MEICLLFFRYTMLTLKQIIENKEEVIRRLAVKHFDAAAILDEVISLDRQRRETQQSLDARLAEQNAIAKEIGALMKAGKKGEAEAIRTKVADMKAESHHLEERKADLENAIRQQLLLIPNLQS